MATFHNTVTIARPAEEAFAFIADFGNIPAWNYAIARIVQTSPGQVGAGATYRHGGTSAPAPASVKVCPVFTAAGEPVKCPVRNRGCRAAYPHLPPAVRCRRADCREA